MSKLPKSVRDVVNEQIMEKAVSDIKELLPFFAFTAKAQFAKFGELKNAGFSTDEAIELCKGPLFVDLTPPNQESK